MRIALVTGAGGPPFVQQIDLPLVDALEERGAQVHRPVWHDPDVDWSSFDAAVVRTTWDYTGRRDEYVEWAARAGELTRLWNPPDVIRWNTHKSYLIELEERGAPVVPTAWLGRGDRVDLRELLVSRSWSQAIVKPAVASGSDGLLRVTVEDRDDAADTNVGQRHLEALLSAGDALVQPFLGAIAERGELSVVVIDGEVSHAVRKRPADGEFRIQMQFGGRYGEEPVGDEVAALARWIVEATGHDLLYARVDLLEDDTGTLQLAELEAAEPDLYFGVAATAASRMADAILRRLND